MIQYFLNGNGTNLHWMPVESKGFSVSDGRIRRLKD